MESPIDRSRQGQRLFRWLTPWSVVPLLAIGVLIGLAGLGRGIRGESTESPAPREARTPAGAPAAAGATPLISRHAEFKPVELNLEAGEQLDYEMRWNGLPAGRASLRVKSRNEKEDPKTWSVRLDTRSSRLVSLFYPVKDKAEAMIDQKSGCSRFFYMQKREGAYKGEERIRFDYNRTKLIAGSTLMRPDGHPSASSIPLFGKVLDPLGALYYLRGLDLVATRQARMQAAAERQAGACSDVEYAKRLEALKVVLPICTDRRVWDTEIRLLTFDELKARNLKPFVKLPGLGNREPCIVVEPLCEFNGLFVRRGPLLLWIHEATRIPVRMLVDLPIGPCEVMLVGYQHSPFNERMTNDD